MSDDLFVLYPKSNFNDISVHDSGQWLDLLLWDNCTNDTAPDADDPDFVPACLGMSEMTYAEAIELGQWLIARGTLGLRRESEKGEAA